MCLEIESEEIQVNRKGAKDAEEFRENLAVNFVLPLRSLRLCGSSSFGRQGGWPAGRTLWESGGIEGPVFQRGEGGGVEIEGFAEGGIDGGVYVNLAVLNIQRGEAALVAAVDVGVVFEDGLLHGGGKG